MAADMLSISRSNDILGACPKAETFCLPRVKCPVKNVIYDRESLRFMLGEQVILNRLIYFLHISNSTLSGMFFSHLFHFLTYGLDLIGLM